MTPAEKFTLLDCDHAHLRDNLFQPVLKFRHECPTCRGELLAEVAREAAEAMRAECVGLLKAFNMRDFIVDQVRAIKVNQ